MPYIYNDEDNAPMNEDPFTGYHNPTVYNSRAEMEAWDSGEAERRLSEKKEADYNRRKDALDGLLDMLELKGKCRECHNITELA